MMVNLKTMISATGQLLKREQTLEIRRDSSRGMSSEQIGASILRNRQARLSKETEQPLTRNTIASPLGAENNQA
jgi:hypothetical protein